jgi:TolB-like protein
VRFGLLACEQGNATLFALDVGIAMDRLRSSQQIVRFGSFELDQAAGELRKDGAKVRLQEQPLEVLQILLELPGKLISRDELQRRIWPSDTFVDFDHGINNAIKRLREALGDTAETPRYIETLPRRGYRFIGTIKADPQDVEGIRSIAVLPFLNLSADPENEFFCDGTTEEIISALSHIRNLHVVARSSAFAFKGKYLDLRAVGQQLNVRTILEGSIRRSGDRLRVTVQLVNAADGYHLWSEKYDREMKDVFAVQEEIANSITQRLEVSGDSERQPLFRAGTENLEAFKFYTQGRSLFFQRGVRLLPAVECFKKAVALDPNYGLAWSGLADSYNSVGFYGLAKPAACLPLAKEAAQRAIALDPSLAEAHTPLAVSHLQYDWDRSGAEREFLRAFELKPQNSLARSWYGLFYLQWAVGRFEEGRAQAEQAVEIDPLSAYARFMLAIAYLPIDADRCVETALKTLEIEPDHYLGRWAQIIGLSSLGRFAEAAEIGELALKMFGRPLWFMATLARTYAHLGKNADSEALYMELAWRAKREYVAPLYLSVAAYAAGKQDDAIRLAEEADAIGDPTWIGAKYWPDLAELRENPRLQEILRRRGWT